MTMTAAVHIRRRTLAGHILAEFFSRLPKNCAYPCFLESLCKREDECFMRK